MTKGSHLPIDFMSSATMNDQHRDSSSCVALYIANHAASAMDFAWEI